MEKQLGYLIVSLLTCHNQRRTPFLVPYFEVVCWSVPKRRRGAGHMIQQLLRTWFGEGGGSFKSCSFSKNKVLSQGALGGLGHKLRRYPTYCSRRKAFCLKYIHTTYPQWEIFPALGMFKNPLLNRRRVTYPRSTYNSEALGCCTVIASLFFSGTTTLMFKSSRSGHGLGMPPPPTRPRGM